MSKNITWDRHAVQRLQIACDLAVLQGLDRFEFGGMGAGTWDGQPIIHVDYAKRLIDAQSKFFNRVSYLEVCGWNRSIW